MNQAVARGADPYVLHGTDDQLMLSESEWVMARAGQATQ